jgi:formate hydrogenlyase subunit 6/NADH:ubiquinone oxidoreductase subunit I
VDCIYIEKSAARKLDKSTGLAVGGAMTRYAIDYAKCMFCGLCVEPCPTSCIHMGNVHDLSGYDRESMIIEFTELARQGLQTPQPLWMRKDRPAAWIKQRKEDWLRFAYSQDGLKGDPERRREAMRAALAPSEPAKKKPDAEAAKAQD